MTMTTDEFAHAQLRGLYIQLTAADLSVQELRAALSQKGEFRTMSQVHDDLKLYGYADYAATHSQPRTPAVAEQPRQAEPTVEDEPDEAEPREAYTPSYNIAGAIRRAERSRR